MVNFLKNKPDRTMFLLLKFTSWLFNVLHHIDVKVITAQLFTVIQQYCSSILQNCHLLIQTRLMTHAIIKIKSTYCRSYNDGIQIIKLAFMLQNTKWVIHVTDACLGKNRPKYILMSWFINHMTTNMKYFWPSPSKLKTEHLQNRTTCGTGFPHVVLTSV